LEESVRVPMIIAFPGRIPKNIVVDRPVGHLDLFATIFDYLGSSGLDDSDGTSLRRHIEGTSTNDNFDERFVVAETDDRYPLSNKKLSGEVSTPGKLAGYLAITVKEFSHLSFRFSFFFFFFSSWVINQTLWFSRVDTSS
jgi:hypothetical protein